MKDILVSYEILILIKDFICSFEVKDVVDDNIFEVVNVIIGVYEW